MNKLGLIFIAIVLIIVGLLASTIVSPVLIIAEDSGEDASVDMAAKFTILGGFDWIYPGSSHNANGETLHNIHLISPDDPYHAAQDIISYTYHYTPHIIVSVNNDAAEAIFGANIVDLIRSNDAYNGYAGNQNVPGTMSRGDAMDTAMNQNGMNVFQIPIQILLGNIRFIFV
ncbi:hypothetical protein [uncultured Methanobrevibacter sp.]|uniref:hypothetical protein n=2 Tax=uncultured Methanobrevibacter sp. TaxID=253161 RepID=UPI0025FF9124|nr:hypothetical protein [uncultured Methanobrevibacter sp.]